jgi:hypothetical protein
LAGCCPSLEMRQKNDFPASFLQVIHLTHCVLYSNLTQQINCGGRWRHGSELDYICAPVK